MRKTLQELRYKCGRNNTDSAIPDTRVNRRVLVSSKSRFLPIPLHGNIKVRRSPNVIWLDLPRIGKVGCWWRLLVILARVGESVGESVENYRKELNSIPNM
jgi:hypothetical protein